MKSIKRIAKLQFKGGQARPGPALASLGINIMGFCQQFNNQTQDQLGELVPVMITVFTDKTFTFVLKTAPTAYLIKKAAKIKKAASVIDIKKPIASLTDAQVTEIAKYKLPDLNTTSLASAKKIVLGTMRQMGIVLKTAEKADHETN